MNEYKLSHNKVNPQLSPMQFRQGKEGSSVFFKDNRHSSVAQPKSLNALEDNRPDPVQKKAMNGNDPVQLVGLDKLSKPKVWQLGHDEVSIQDQIMAHLNQVIEQSGEQAKAVFRLCTVELLHDKDKNISAKVSQPVLKVPQGLEPGYKYVSGNSGLQDAIARNVMATLQGSGQLEYVRANGLINDQWRIIVDVDFYYSRPPQQIGFHKDTIGRSLFVNLNFNNEDTIAGPEYISNPDAVAEHDQHIGPKLPKPFLDDLSSERKRMGKPTQIGATIIPKKGNISFVDELMHHSTPYLDHRGVSGRQLDTSLEGGANGAVYRKIKAADRFTTLLDGTHKSKITSRQDLLEMGLTLEQVNHLHQRMSFITTGYMQQKLKVSQQFADMKKLLADNPDIVKQVITGHAPGEENELYNKVKAAYNFEKLLQGTHKAKITSAEDLLAMGLTKEQVDHLHLGVQFLTSGYMLQQLRLSEEFGNMRKLLAENPVLVKMARLARSGGHYDKKQLMSNGMTGQEADALFNVHGKPDLDHVSLAHCEDHCDVNTDNSNYPILPQHQPKLRRQMSQLLLAGRAPKPSIGKRQFFRTWVQAIPTDKKEESKEGSDK